MRAFLTSLILLLATHAHAATVTALALPDLARTADRIVHGRCLSATAETSPAGIRTRYRFAVDETVKGSPSATTELVLPGGTVNGRRCQIPGMPGFAPGDEVVLFITPAGQQVTGWPVGLGQGKFRVSRDPAAKAARVFQDLQGLNLAGRPTSAAAGALAGDGATLTEFLQTVRRLVSSTRTGGDHGR
jgi:hypothetical protein